MLALLLPLVAPPQGICEFVSAREIAIPGGPVWIKEPHLAIDKQGHPFIVCTESENPDPATVLRWAKRTDTGWIHGPVVDINGIVNEIDPVVAYDTVNDRFLLATFLAEKVRIRRFDNATESWLLDEPATAITMYDPPPPPPPFVQERIDKPWLVAGFNSLSIQEFYAVILDTTVLPDPLQGYQFSRSIDGGVTWAASLVNDDLGQTLSGIYTAEMSVARTDLHLPVYLAYAPPVGVGNEFRFLKGADASKAGPGPTTFSELRTAGGGLAIVFLEASTGAVQNRIPGSFDARRQPRVVADQRDPDRFFVVYHDASSVDPNDINVYCQRLDRNPLNDRWSILPRVKVNQDNTGRSQFLPNAMTDGQGRIHVTFYDDRDFVNDGTSPPIFDYYYAVSVDDGATFTDCKLHGEPPMDWVTLDLGLTTHFSRGPPGEYGGLQGIEDSDGSTYVLAAYTGTAPNGNGGAEPTVIYTSLISYPAP